MTASLLPNGEQQFIDGNGVPLAEGKVYFYVPNTSTFKDTWQDAEQQTLNTNPVILDAAGRAVIYGSGEYRQVVTDKDDNLVWDKPTADLIGLLQSSVALYCGTSTGTANAQYVDPDPEVTSIEEGQQFSFFAGFSNTSAMTLTINSFTYAVKIGASSTHANAVRAGTAVLVQFDGTDLQLVNPKPIQDLPAPGSSGNLLESNGTIWTSAAPKLPAPGAAGQVVTSNGAAWISSEIPPPASLVQTFTSNGTWTKPSSADFDSTAIVLIECWGAGGGGGSNSGSGGNGGSGSSSSFGSWVTAYGGTGGRITTQMSGGCGGGFGSTASNGAFNDTGFEGIGSGLDSNILSCPIVLSSGTTDIVFNRATGGYYTGGGGGNGDPTTSFNTLASAAGGNSVYGGGGGAGYSGSDGASGAAGTSQFGGNGGVAGSNGTAPGGGGGGYSGLSSPGGGGGGYKYRFVSLSSLSATETVIVGSGGTAGTAGAGAGARGQVRITIF